MLRSLAFLALLSFSIPSLAAETITMANDPWPPYVLGDEADGSPAKAGIAVELIDLIFQQLENHDAQILLIPWRKALNGVKKGHFDGIPLLFKTPERESYMLFSEPLFPARTVFFYNMEKYPNGIRWKNYQDLSHFNIAVQHSFSIAETFDQQIALGVPLMVEKMNSDEDCFRLLIHGRVDLVATNEIVGQEYLKQLGVSSSFRASSQSLYEKPFYIGFSKKTDAHLLIPQINSVIGQLQATGEIDRVLGSTTP
ncbi:substrate-binding periplasmic protein [Motiliproteus sp.]|uniref:substrate-binding periplasmic protein n=1 Tax=Motiliproteus sp. TaxID=1898955 RepID=UPI003BAC7568